MRVRLLKDSDVNTLKAIYDRGELKDGWPDLESASIVRVLEDESGEILGMAGARMVPEVFVLLKDAHPAAKMGWLRQLHQELLAYMHDTGHRRAIALIAPKIERSFLRRLISLGWKEGCQSAIFEVADEGQRRKISGPR